MFKFEGRTTVIRGGAEGIGLYFAKALGEQKMNIVLADIDEKNLFKSTAELASLGISVLATLLDVAKGAAIVNAAGGTDNIINQRDNFQVDVFFSNSKILD